MLVAAVGHFFAFPYKEYAGANIGGSRGLTASLAHALMLNDFYHDTVHQVSLTVYILLNAAILYIVSIFLSTRLNPWLCYHYFVVLVPRFHLKNSGSSFVSCNLY